MFQKLTQMGYNKETVTELMKLYELRGLKDNKSKAERRKQRQVLHNMGFLSLPFSMNTKRE